MCHPKNLFGDDASIIVNKSMDGDAWPKTWNRKSIHHP